MRTVSTVCLVVCVMFVASSDVFQQTFKTADRNDDGVIDEDEFERMAEKSNIAGSMFKSWDRNRDGVLSSRELAAGFGMRHTQMEKKRKPKRNSSFELSAYGNRLVMAGVLLVWFLVSVRYLFRYLRSLWKQRTTPTPSTDTIQQQQAPNNDLVTGVVVLLAVAVGLMAFTPGNRVYVTLSELLRNMVT